MSVLEAPRQQFIDGELSDGGGAPLPVENPYTEQAFAEVRCSTVDDVDRAIAAARRAQDSGPWPRMSRHERGEAMHRLADAIEARADDLRELHLAETGMFRIMNDGVGVNQPIQWWRGYAELAARDWDHAVPPVEMDIGISKLFAGGMVFQEPAGVVAAIVPYNFPFFVATHKVGAAMAAGCSVVLKSSELTPLTCALIADACLDADIPPGVFNYVIGEAEVGARLGEHPYVDVVSFTGSTAVGKKIMVAAADTVKKVVLELGGKSAMVVFPDADLNLAAPMMLGQFSHSGQGCALNTRLVVHESIADQVVGMVESMIPFLVPGDPADPGTTHNPQISAVARQRVLGHIEAGKSSGATLVAGGHAMPEMPHGHWIAPTLFDHCPVDASVAQEEIFGPVLVVHRFSSDEEAIAIANNSRYGLWGSVLTADIPRGIAVARQVRTGSMGINGIGLNFHAPFGGVKQSGIGREFGEYGVREFFEPKSISWAS